MRFSIVIPCFNKAEFTRRCLESLHERTGNSIEWEIIIVDNGSTDETAAMAESWPGGRVRLVKNQTNLGFAKACNQGAQAARGDLVFFLNNDTECFDNWLPPLLETIEREKVGVVGCRLVYPDGRIQHAGMVIRERNPEELILWDHIYRFLPADHPCVNREREFQSVTGATFLIRKSLFEKLGGFDEGFVNGWEDPDLCLRARQAGYKIIYQPRSAFVHFESTTPGRLAREKQNTLRFFDKWEGKVSADEAQAYLDDGYDRIGNLAKIRAAMRGRAARWFPMPDFYPPGRQPPVPRQLDDVCEALVLASFAMDHTMALLPTALLSSEPMAKGAQLPFGMPIPPANIGKNSQ